MPAKKIYIGAMIALILIIAAVFGLWRQLPFVRNWFFFQHPLHRQATSLIIVVLIGVAYWGVLCLWLGQAFFTAGWYGFKLLQMPENAASQTRRNWKMAVKYCSFPLVIMLSLINLFGNKQDVANQLAGQPVKNYIFSWPFLVSIAVTLVTTIGVMALCAIYAYFSSIHRIMEWGAGGGSATTIINDLLERGGKNEAYFHEMFSYYEGSIRHVEKVYLKWRKSARSRGFLDQELLRALSLKEMRKLRRKNINSDHESTGDSMQGYFFLPIPISVNRWLGDDGNVKSGKILDGNQDLPPYVAQSRQRLRLNTQLVNIRACRESLRQSDLDVKAAEQEKGWNHCLDKLELDPEQGTFRLHVQRAKYGQIMRTHDALIEESLLTAAFMAEKRKDFRRAEKLLSWRNQMFPLTSKDAMELASTIFHLNVASSAERKGRYKPVRASGLGISCVICYREEASGEYRLLYVKRSETVGTYPGFYHALPAGMFNDKLNPLSRAHIFRIVATEFLEEARNRIRLEGIDYGREWVRLLHLEMQTFLNHAGQIKTITESEWERIKKTSPGKKFEETMESRKVASKTSSETKGELLDLELDRNADELDVHIIPLGLAFDLLNLRPEICVIAYFSGKRAEEARANLALNWESVQIYDDKHFSETSTNEWVRSGLAIYQAASVLIGNLKKSVKNGDVERFIVNSRNNSDSAIYSWRQYLTDPASPL